MDFIREFLQKEVIKRIIILSCVAIVLYLIRSMLNLLLLTFIFTFLMYSIQNFLIQRLRKIVRVKQRIMVIFLYLVLGFAIVFGLYKYIPVIANQTTAVINQAVDFYEKPHQTEIEQYIVDFFKNIKLEGYTDQGVDFLVKVSKWGMNIFIALILSLFFLLEKNRIIRFTSRFKTSKISFVYKEVEYFGKKFTNSFGKVIEAQMLIALINGVLSVISLWIMGFPQLLGLGIMVFLLGLIPVAGVIISLIPLCIVAFSIGGITKIVYVIIMVAVLHALEAYVLNPKLMSSKTELPVFYTFLVLLFSEHFLGVWGLIIGIPIFIFLLDLLDVKGKETP